MRQLHQRPRRVQAGQGVRRHARRLPAKVRRPGATGWPRHLHPAWTHLEPPPPRALPRQRAPTHPLLPTTAVLPSRALPSNSPLRTWSGSKNEMATRMKPPAEPWPAAEDNWGRPSARSPAATAPRCTVAGVAAFFLPGARRPKPASPAETPPKHTHTHTPGLYSSKYLSTGAASRMSCGRRRAGNTRARGRTVRTRAREARRPELCPVLQPPLQAEALQQWAGMPSTPPCGVSGPPPCLSMQHAARRGGQCKAANPAAGGGAPACAGPLPPAHLHVDAAGRHNGGRAALAARLLRPAQHDAQLACTLQHFERQLLHPGDAVVSHALRAGQLLLQGWRGGGGGEGEGKRPDRLRARAGNGQQRKPRSRSLEGGGVPGAGCACYPSRRLLTPHICLHDPSGVAAPSRSWARHESPLQAAGASHAGGSWRCRTSPWITAAWHGTGHHNVLRAGLYSRFQRHSLVQDPCRWTLRCPRLTPSIALFKVAVPDRRILSIMPRRLQHINHQVAQQGGLHSCHLRAMLCCSQGKDRNR